MLTQIPKALLNAHLNIVLEKTAILKQMSAAPFCKHYVTFCTEGKKKCLWAKKFLIQPESKGTPCLTASCKRARSDYLHSRASLKVNRQNCEIKRDEGGGGKVTFLEEKTGNNQSLFTAMFVQFKLASKPGSAEERWIWLLWKNGFDFFFFCLNFAGSDAATAGIIGGHTFVWKFERLSSFLKSNFVYIFSSLNFAVDPPSPPPLLLLPSQPFAVLILSNTLKNCQI